ncbi:MAG: tRNA (guanosine(46)-N7)-methyltransferase TrmB [Gammaproteobacteria bacterium]
MSEQERHRPIRSFVVRGGRLTPSQQEAIDRLWPRYGLESDQGLIDRQAMFGRVAELVFEIGFGMGDSLVSMAAQHPERDYIGIDVHPPGIGTILRGIHAKGLENLRVMQGDAMDMLDKCFVDYELDRIQIYFPDPWHKKRHHKRRMVQPPFVADLAGKMRQGAILHLATDWENYAEQMMEVMTASSQFRNVAGEGQFAREHERAETKFERRGRRLGHGVWDLVFEKVD